MARNRSSDPSTVRRRRQYAPAVTRDRLAVPILIAWTAFIWISRLRNVLGNDDLSSAAELWRISVVVVFVALAGGALWAWRSRHDEPGRSRWPVRVLCVWTVGFWTVRGVGIVLDDHTVGFTVVHTVLMAISIGLAVWAWPQPRASMAQPDSAV